MLELKNVKKKYGKKLVIDIDSLTIENGKIVGVFGSNGSGKSTLMKCISNLLPYSGEILIDGIDVQKNSVALKTMGLLIESPSFYNSLSAKDNLDYFLDEPQLAFNILKDLDMEENINDKVKTFSLGMKQKLGFALACSKGKKLIILDEPFNGMDSTSIKKCFNIIRSLKQIGITILISSHQLKDFEKICDYSLRIRNHRVEQIEENIFIERTIFVYFEDNEHSQKAFSAISSYYECFNKDSMVCILFKGGDFISDLLEKIKEYNFTNYEMSSIPYAELVEVNNNEERI